MYSVRAAPGQLGVLASSRTLAAPSRSRHRAGCGRDEIRELDHATDGYLKFVLDRPPGLCEGLSERPMRILAKAKNQTHTFDGEAGEKILDAGLRSGIALPYECGSGTCGTCRARLVGGDIEAPWPEAPGRLMLKPETGEFLMCQCVALTDCVLEVPGKPGWTLPSSASSFVITAWSGRISSRPTRYGIPRGGFRS